MSEFHDSIHGYLFDQLGLPLEGKMYFGPEGTLNAVRHRAIRTLDELVRSFKTDETMWVVVPVDRDE